MLFRSLPADWERVDVVFEFESDENWNMSGPEIANLKVVGSSADSEEATE